MEQIVELLLPFDDAESAELVRREIGAKLKLDPTRIAHVVLERRSIDARRGVPRLQLRLRVWIDETPSLPPAWQPRWQQVAKARPVIIVGFGPAGMFAALRCLDLGLKPIVLERGKPVRERRHDLAAIMKRGVVNPESNYCFGEGGAGTFSDGKLYTRAHKRGSIEEVLRILHFHGASADVLIDAHPHIGTNRLPAVVQSIRESVIAHGGEVRFGARVAALLRSSAGVRGVRLADGEVVESDAVILATGHSARDVFSLCVDAGVALERKPFALGVRVEHPQSLINRIQYRAVDFTKLPSASYALKAQVEGKGVFSFCMCPGGIICPAATNADEIVVNGWSPSKRNSRYANSGIVVQIEDRDLIESGALAGVSFQRSIEQRAALVGGGEQRAPAQRLVDFVEGRASSTMPDCSYAPGIVSADLREVFPQWIAERLAVAFRSYGSQLRGYLTNDAVVVGPESRTSSPVRIPRDNQTLMSPSLPGLFPSGEGAGYAGGIVSAAMDGLAVSQAAARHLTAK